MREPTTMCKNGASLQCDAEKWAPPMRKQKTRRRKQQCKKNRPYWAALPMCAHMTFMSSVDQSTIAHCISTTNLISCFHARPRQPINNRIHYIQSPHNTLIHTRKQNAVQNENNNERIINELKKNWTKS